MNIAIQFSLKNVLLIALVLGVWSCSKKQNDLFPQKAKIVLREVGHNLLLADQDSTSLVQPVVELGSSSYQLSFVEQLEIDPDSLVFFMENSVRKGLSPQDYLLEVIQCDDMEVAYSYYKESQTGNTDIHCRNRRLQKGCYRINVTFISQPKKTDTALSSYLYMVLGIVLVSTTLVLCFKRRSRAIQAVGDKDYEYIGKYKFYPEQKKLIKEATEIGLSKKECELLLLFIAHPHQIMKREELMKRIWEDKGVVVGRSLDTYISRLRKKLQEDPTVKLTNIHGVGYRLEF